MRSDIFSTSRNENVPIPNLPGYRPAQKDAQSRPMSLSFKNGMPTIRSEVPAPLMEVQNNVQKYNWVGEAPPVVLKPLTQAEAAKAKESMEWTGAKTPGWLLYDKKILRFFAYFVEKVEHSSVEQQRIRRVTITYHFEDNTIEIEEPKEANSGLPQGKFLSRHQVKLANGKHLTWSDILVGKELNLYGRTLHVSGCDKVTREHFIAQGIRLPEDVPLPQGSYDLLLKEQAERDLEKQNLASHRPPRNPKDTTLDPLASLDSRGPGSVFEVQYDRSKQNSLSNKVLRFFCAFDGTETRGTGKGDILPYELHYFLEDDSIEVVEVHKKNSGRDPFPKLLSRRQVPKAPSVPPVFGRPMSPRTRSMLNVTFYNWKDLQIGSWVSIYNRPLFIHDCDDFTRQWCREQGGSSQPSGIAVDFNLSVKRPPLLIPPNEGGFGSEEDSLRNVMNPLIPKREMRSYFEYLSNWDKVLRFKARMVPIPPQREHIVPHDASRRFIFSFHILDGTISIFEPKVPNSGLQGGTYLERCKVWKPVAGGAGGLAASGRRDAYSVADVRVGEILNVFARGFEILSPDEKTIRYMEQDPQKFPYASYPLIMNKICPLAPQALETLRASLASLYDFQQSSEVSPAHLKEALRRSGVEIGLHEALTIVRELSGAWERPMSLSVSDRAPVNLSTGEGSVTLTVGIDKILAVFQGLPLSQPQPSKEAPSIPQPLPAAAPQRLHSDGGAGSFDFAYQKKREITPPAFARTSDPGNESYKAKHNLIAPLPIGVKQPSTLWATTNQKAFR